MREFGRGYPMPPKLLEFVTTNGFEDTSWHNDISPSFTYTGKGFNVIIWVEHEDPEERESGSHNRFMLTFGSVDHSEHVDLLDTDSLDELLGGARVAMLTADGISGHRLLL
jgi:hypothetical protein